MHGKDDALALLRGNTASRCQYFHLMTEIQAAGGLIKKQPIRLLNKSAGQRNLLALPSGKVGKRTLRERIQIQPGKNRPRQRHIGRGRPPHKPRFASKQYELKYAERKTQGHILRDIGELAGTPLGGHASYRHTRQEHFARGRFQDSQQQLEERRFSGSVGTENGTDPTASKREGKALNEGPPCRISKRQIAEFKHDSALSASTARRRKERREKRSKSRWV